MVNANSTESGGSPMSPESRAESVVRAILDVGLARESQIRAAVADAISTAIAEERTICARLLDAIRDEFIEWCAVNRISSIEQVQIANMLSKAAASIRERARQR